MNLHSLSSWFAYLLVILAINEASCHPKSWLTTTVRPKINLVKRPKRSVAQVDVTYYPGLTLEYKDALRFEELRKFLREEEEEAESLEEVIIRLLQEEQESTTDEPIEFAVQKRVMMQLKDPQSQMQDAIDATEYPSDEDFVVDSLREITHSQIYGNDYLESSKYTIEDAKPYNHATASESSVDHPKIDDIPDAVIKRLLSDESTTSHEHNDETESHQQYISTHHNLPFHHDVVVNHRHRQNFDHDTRREFLLNRLLDHQEQIDAEDLGFLAESNEEEPENYMEINSPREEEVESDDISEAQLDWEEYHEYDA